MRQGEPLESRRLLSTDPIVTVNTNYGSFQIQTLPSAAPNTVANFLSYVDGNDYTDAIFHRSAPGFVEQTGGYTSSLATFGGSTSQFTPIITHSPINLEYSVPNTRGTVAMARGSTANSATNQWFVNLADNSQNLGPSNGGGYAVFGQVLGNGMSVIDQMAALPTNNIDNGTFSQLPLGPGSQLVRISSITVDSIDGTVFSDTNANGQLDAGEPPLAGRRVFVDVDGTGTLDSNNPSTTTDANGHFSFTGITPGTYTVREVVPSSGTLTTAVQTVTVAADQTASGVIFGERPSILGAVFIDANGNGHFDAGEVPAVGRTVFLDVDGSGAPDRSNPSTTTDANGNFSF
ncbi:MAG: peptidylprolyl isomerase, partial [Candidatus Saccharimonadales bacterium]